MPGRLTLLIATLSLTVTVNDTICSCDEVLSSTVAFALIVHMGLDRQSLILIVISCVTECALSVTVAVNVSLVLPSYNQHSRIPW